MCRGTFLIFNNLIVFYMFFTGFTIDRYARNSKTFVNLSLFLHVKKGLRAKMVSKETDADIDRADEKS